MGTAIFHPNMVRKCRQKRRYETEHEARENALPTMVIIWCPVCQGYHFTHRKQDNYLSMTATPDEIVEMFR